MNREFIIVVSLCGCRRIIKWQDPADGSHFINPTVEDEHQKILQRYRASAPIHIAQKEFEAEIKQLAVLIKGNELPGMEGLTLAMPIFYDQSEPWGYINIASRHIELVLEKTRSVIEEVMEHITENDESTRENIVHAFIESFFKNRYEVLEAKIQDLLPLQHKSKFPVAIEDIFTFRLDSRQKHRHHRMQLKRTEQTTNVEQSPQPQSSQTVENAASVDRPIDRVLDQMVTYYDVRNTTRKATK